ncbi:MAG: hypothetical protein WBA61_05075 [Aequorivita sp.]
MKNVFKISSITLSAILLITSCSKNDDETLEPSGLIETEITQVEMQNRANPLDDQGEMYGEFLTVLEFNGDIGGWDVGQLAQFNGDDDSWDVGQIFENNGIGGWDVGQIASAAMKFNESKGRDFGDEARRNLMLQLEALSGLATFNPIDDCKWRPDRCKWLKATVAAMDISNGESAHDRTIKFIDEIRDQEAEIQMDGEMGQAEKNTLLISLSIARHAAGYWYNQALKNNKANTKIPMNMIQLSTLGASTGLMATESEEVGVGTAILNAYIATGRAN